VSANADAAPVEFALGAPPQRMASVRAYAHLRVRPSGTIAAVGYNHKIV
jgi:hypothetical protein